MTPAIAVLTALLAAICALAATPLALRVAKLIGAVDAPDKDRKTQSEAVALLGGVAVAFAATAAAVTVFASGWIETRPELATMLRGLLPALVVMGAVGLVDDLIGLTGIYKLIGQILSVGLLVSDGFGFHVISLFGYELPTTGYSVALTMFFCLGAVNAFNLIDGIDGLASSVGAVVLATLGIVAAALSHAGAAVICFAAAGALVGFLRFNGAPARIYLGDTGSMLIGLLVSAIAVHCATKTQAAFALMVPVAICAIPILDAAAAIVRRVTTGQSVFTPDRGHLHHSLLLRGWSVRKTTAAIAGLTAITCAGALLTFFTGNDVYAFAGAAGVFGVLAATNIFGHVEVKLVATKTKGALRKVWKNARAAPASANEPATETVVHLQGTRAWKDFWEGLTNAAERHQLASLRLTVSIPRLHEQFYATWSATQRPAAAESTERGWSLTLPLRYEGRDIGKISAAGTRGGLAGAVQMQELLDNVEPLEASLARVIRLEEQVALQEETSGAAERVSELVAT